jgi:hypothetical protein
MIIDQDFKKFNNRVNKMLEDKKIKEGVANEQKSY